ncbi:PEP-utilizing enzyme [Amycolatopsis endophytica]|uniref:Phosphohistidine swiveling domain-containing protein n=1 Tax=Amycolatopsis endophytica TaxID=860233 RepID=A0A853BD52_9PSEU|nr:PEP-utilizing enzyme [Amycolatopsis endophytica]NYI93348.1 phosphohistidine swiveling domain-containing protein [Amycolatopsis endophytica]
MHAPVSPETEPFEFGTKAETLARLSTLIRSAVVLPMESFTVAQWRDDPHDVLDRVRAHSWSDVPLIVRSSSRDEDRAGFSNAGRYLSLSDVYGQHELRRAVDVVVRSFDDHPGNQVLVQPQLRDAVASGVVSSCEPSGGAPYRVVNWCEGPDTAEVTSGRGTVRTWYFLAGGDPEPPSPLLVGLPELIAELGDVSGDEPFEFEFGVARDGTLVLFQVRPLATARLPLSRRRHRAAVSACQAQVATLQSAGPPALSRDTVLGVMPDWNPAEMIGVRPRPLALSLYRRLITDGIWADSRHRYGYRDLRGTPLLADLGGLAYIDTRASFSSLVPAALDDVTAIRLVRHYLARLRANPHLHDKVEFAIALSSFHFGTPEDAARLCDEGVLQPAEAAILVRALRSLTVHMMSLCGPFARDVSELDRLAQWEMRRPLRWTPVRIPALVHLCRTQGTLPFAGAARAAFAATALVRSLVDAGVLSPADADALIGSATTVSTEMQRDFATVGRATFLDRYGHLRPGTYDILSARYDEEPDRYFDWTAREAPPRPPRFHPTPAQARDVRELLIANRMPGTERDLFRFVTSAVSAREYGKLQFSRVLSEILVEARRVGELLGFTPDDLSYSTIDVLTQLTGSARTDVAFLDESIARGRARHALTESLCAPAVITGAPELASFVALPGETNFVTQSRVAARVADVGAGDDPAGAVAMITAADPGYDWIFTKGIAGLVTAFGGANSHMAIRALELGIPAAIGVGETQFRRWLTAGALEVDAAARVVRPVPVAGRRVAEARAS